VSLFVLDTDALSKLWTGDQKVAARVLSVPADELAVTVITVEEMLTGWQTMLRQAKTDAQIAAVYGRMASTVELLGRFTVLSYSEVAIATYRSVRSQRFNVGANDIRIGAIALEHGATVVTRNVRDFSRIPGLTVENWCD
jgi:tRNA(fMet)-specific endonuclease VapC